METNPTSIARSSRSPDAEPLPHAFGEAAPKPHISICICTFKRPELLAHLLRELGCQETHELFTYGIVVADNDATRSAEEVVCRLGRELTVPVRYCVQSKQNIALVRNTALANATGDFIAFIDDDEFPAARWLVELFETRRNYGSDGVLGPVIPRFKETPPAWLIEGGFCDRPTHPTGFTIDASEGRTGNLLFRRELLDGMDPVFRSEFGGGGEDRDFFRRLAEAGRTFVWCNEAVAYEWVPPVRMKRRFLLRRALLRGKMSLGHRRGPWDLTKSVFALGAYSLVLPVLLATKHYLFMRYLIKVCDHAGKLLAFAGINPVRENYVME